MREIAVLNHLPGPHVTDKPGSSHHFIFVFNEKEQDIDCFGTEGLSVPAAQKDEASRVEIEGAKLIAHDGIRLHFVRSPTTVYVGGTARIEK